MYYFSFYICFNQGRLTQHSDVALNMISFLMNKQSKCFFLSIWFELNITHEAPISDKANSPDSWRKIMKVTYIWKWEHVGVSPGSIIMKNYKGCSTPLTIHKGLTRVIEMDSTCKVHHCYYSWNCISLFRHTISMKCDSLNDLKNIQNI